MGGSVPAAENLGTPCTAYGVTITLVPIVDHS